MLLSREPSTHGPVEHRGVGDFTVHGEADSYPSQAGVAGVLAPARVPEDAQRLRLCAVAQAVLTELVDAM